MGSASEGLAGWVGLPSADDVAGVIRESAAPVAETASAVRTVSIVATMVLVVIVGAAIFFAVRYA